MTEFEKVVTSRHNLRLGLLKQVYDNYFAGGNGTTLYKVKLDQEGGLACRYLADKGFIKLESCGGLQPSLKCTITIEGIDHLEANSGAAAALNAEKPGDNGRAAAQAPPGNGESKSPSQVPTAGGPGTGTNPPGFRRPSIAAYR